MAQAIQIVSGGRECVVRLPDARELIGELHRLPPQGYPDAVAAALIIESAIASETALPDVTFNEGERAAMLRVLVAMEVAHEVLAEGLQCLREGLRNQLGEQWPRWR